MLHQGRHLEPVTGTASSAASSLSPLFLLLVKALYFSFNYWQSDYSPNRLPFFSDSCLESIYYFSLSDLLALSFCVSNVDRKKPLIVTSNNNNNQVTLPRREGRPRFGVEPTSPFAEALEKSQKFYLKSPCLHLCPSLT